MRILVRKVLVDSIAPMANADTLELARIKGWQCVVRKGEFRAGGTALYFEIDSALPYGDARYEFLRARCAKTWKSSDGTVLKQVLRIRTMTLRGELSQGLLLPADGFPEIAGIPIGEDCAGVLGVEHYDEVREKYDAMTGKAKIAGETMGSYPWFLQKSDEERIQNLGDDFVREHAAERFEVTEKRDGCSVTYFYAPEESPEAPFGICSRNLRLKDSGDSVFVRAADSFAIRDKLKAFGPPIAIQGEITGPGINGTRDRLVDIAFEVYRVFLKSTTQSSWVPAAPDVARTAVRLLGLQYVPVLADSVPLGECGATVADLLKYAEGKTANGNPREGVVFKGVESNTHFKAVSNAYLLKEK